MISIKETEKLETSLSAPIVSLLPGVTVDLNSPPGKQTGYGIIYSSNIKVGETVSWSLVSGSTVTLDGRGLDGSTAQTWSKNDNFVTGPTLSYLDSLRTACYDLQTQVNLLSTGVFPSLGVTDDGGLDITVASGSFYSLNTGSLIAYAGSTGNTLTDNATTYVEMTLTGTLILNNTTGFTAGYIPLAQIVTTAGDITNLIDKRPFITGGSRVDAIHTLTDGSTIATDFSLSTSYKVVLAGTNRVFIISNLYNCTKQFFIYQDATGSRTILDFKWKTETFTADSTNEQLTVATVYKTGQRVRVSNTGGALPTGLSAATDYYAIYVSDTSIKLATSRANAIAGTAIDITANGSGTNTIESYAHYASGTKPTLTTTAGACDILIAQYLDNTFTIYEGSFDIK